MSRLCINNERGLDLSHSASFPFLLQKGMLEFSLSKKAVKQMMVQGCQSQNDGLGIASEDEKNLMDADMDISESDFDKVNVEEEWKKAETPAEGNRDVPCDEHYEYSIGGSTPIRLFGGIFGKMTGAYLRPELVSICT